MNEAVHPRLIDMTGLKVNNLLVLRKARPEEKPMMKTAHKQTFWICRCNRCGRENIKAYPLLKRQTARCVCDINDRRGRPAQPWKLPSSLAKLGGVESRCPVCGHTYARTSNKWAYHVSGRYFCSWHCQRQWEKEMEARKHV